METVLQVVVLCVLGTVMALVLKVHTPELALLMTLLVVIFVFLRLADGVMTLYGILQELGAISGISEQLFVPIYKTMGIALVVKVGGSLCRDAGESAMEAAIELAGTVCAFLTALPLFHAVLDMLMEMMG